MPKKKRPSSALGSPAERRIKYDSRGDVMVARDRLKGALQDLLNSDEDSSSSQDDSQNTSSKLIQVMKREKEVKPPIIRRRKRKAALDLELAFQHTYVMKLFDRSVDLAQFKEGTPLYPICRAWIANQPRVPLPYPPMESPEIKSEIEGMIELDSSIVRDVYRLPQPSSPPPPNRTPTTEKLPLKGISLDYSSDDLPSAKDLLKEHVARWVNVRQKWIEAAQNNELRFHNSGTVLSNMYKRAQSTFL